MPTHHGLMHRVVRSVNQARASAVYSSAIYLSATAAATPAAPAPAPTPSSSGAGAIAPAAVV